MASSIELTTQSTGNSNLILAEDPGDTLAAGETFEAEISSIVELTDDWEVSRCTYISNGEFSRDSVIVSGANNGYINFGEGLKTVAIQLSPEQLIRNSTGVYISNYSIYISNDTVNTGISLPTANEYNGSYYLHANGSWAAVSNVGGGGSPPGGANTYIQYNDDGVLGGSNGFTFDEITNNVYIANTLSVGNSTVAINSESISIGNTTVNGFANSIFIGVSNSTGATTLRPTGISIDHTSTANVYANSTLFSLANSTGTANVTPTTLRIGNTSVNLVANSTTIKLANSTTNTAIVIPSAAQYAGAYYLKADGSWSTVTAGSAAPAGANTHVQYNDSGTTGGVAAFTFDEVTNNVFIANNLTTGVSVNVGANVQLTTVKLSIGNSTVNVSANSSAALISDSLYIGNTSINLVANSTLVKLSNTTINTAITIPTAAQYAGAYYLHANGQWSTVSAGSAAPAGGDTHVQYNDGGTTGGTAGFTFNDTTNNVLIANTLSVANVTISNKITANGGIGVSGQVLTSNSLGGVYWATGGGGGDVTKVGTPVDNQVGVWTGSGTIEGTAGFTFNSTGNIALIANSLTIGSATINSTNYSQTANNSASFAGQGQAYYANVTSPSFSTSVSVGANVVANTTTLRVGDSAVNLVANSSTMKIANSTVNTQIAIPTSAQYGGNYYLHANGQWSTVSAGSAAPAGADTHVQYNDGGVTGGIAGFTFNDTTNNVLIANTLTVANVTISNKITANGALGTASQVLTSNSLGGVYWATVAGGGDVSKVGTPVDNQVGVWTGSGTIEGTAGLTFDAASNNAVVANTVSAANVTVTNKITANGAQGTASQILTSNSTGGVYWAAPAGGGDVTKVGTPVDNQVGVWTGSGTIEGTAGLTFDAASNNAVVANTLTVGSATINSTNYSQTANNALNLGGTAAASYQLNSTLAANVATMTANNANSLGGTLASAYQLNSTLAANVATMTANNATWLGTSIFANSLGAYPTSNTVGAVLGNTISRVIITGNSATFSSTLAATDTTITGFVNATVSVNSALYTIGTTFIANTLGVYHTGTINAASFTTTGFRANTIGVYPTSNSSGQLFGNSISRWAIFANTIDITTSITANGALGTAAQILTSNSLGGVYWAAAAAGGDVTKVGTPVDNQVGVWTGSGTIEGTAAFTFNATGNNATIANTLTVGTATVNSTLAAVTALNVTNQINTATLFATTSVNVGANVQANTTAIFIGNTTVNGTVNSVFVGVSNSTGSANLTPIDLKVGVSVVNSTVAAVGANVTVNTISFRVGNSLVNTVMSNVSIFFGNSSVSSTINSTSYTGTANNATNLGGTASGSYQLNSTLSANVAGMTANNSTNLGGVASGSYCRLDTADQAITGGGRVTVLDLGNLSGTTKTPDPGDRPIQKITNNGAGTIAPGTNFGNYILDVMNASGAGSITTTGWFVEGDVFDTTAASKFRCHCSVTGDANVMIITKLV